MSFTKYKIDLVALYSGGLDSLLAMRLLRDQGRNLLALKFEHPFNKNLWRNSFKEYWDADLESAVWEVPLGQEFLDVILKPKYGYGKNFNPCIDCKIYMYKRAVKIIQEVGAYGLVTGEVLGQRPMSQNQSALALIENETYTRGLVLRPLSAQLLPETRIEQEHLVNRDRLLGLSGRNRTPQMELAKQWGISEYQTPAGGCLLTDIGYTKRLQEAIRHKQLSIFDTQLLKLGRHFRLPSGAKLIVGRFEEENNLLALLGKGRLIMMEDAVNKGPVGLLEGEAKTVNMSISGRIITRYSKSKEGKEAKVRYQLPNRDGWNELNVMPGDDEIIEELIIVPDK
ncbi:hypothetical protein JXI42_01185 [bacterium]|nr:hypothetical protein [bacterium]